MSIRNPAVAGLFYPDDPHELQQTVNQLLEQAKPKTITPKVLIEPHAGYIYSGPAAAAGYRLLTAVAEQIHKVVLLGPSHRVALRGLALPDSDQFVTPLGNIPIDQQLANQISTLPQVVRMAEAHLLEHSLEVQLPFLQAVLHQFTLLPLVVGDASPAEVAEVLAKVWGGEETLIVISTDLSHFHNYREANRIDDETSKKILNLDADLHGNQACGCRPLNGLLKLARDKQLHIRELARNNSGDTAGDKDSVVGYGAFALYP